ncbi:small mechanosensitive ion channel protein MscS [Oceanobacillus picturae]|uniref:Small mechanosensitive ion channel protein MscS n=1 Tax=Oceanobacillus picturae TaxID=171693 RepID=A0A0U9HDZ7_9BACI|nr:hypothetical protein [Oceanobacillus picturae]GAQ19489.1 small mechanosensitive ion channel protein MscS [Oceanobacillus picturae]
MTEYLHKFYEQGMEKSEEDYEYWNSMIERMEVEGMDEFGIYDLTVKNKNEAFERIQFYRSKLEDYINYQGYVEEHNDIWAEECEL